MSDTVERLQAEIASLQDAATETQRLMAQLNAENEELRITVNDQAATITGLLREIDRLLATRNDMGIGR